MHAFAANPHEQVHQPAIISTFFPHFAPRRLLQMRWVLLVGVVVIFLIGLGRYVPVAIVAAALLVPVLYLLYFYDVALYEDEPLWVLGATFVLSAVLGVAMSLFFYPIILQNTRIGFGVGPNPTYVWLTGVGLPVLGQAVMLVGPLLLFFTRRHFDEVLDGLSFGVASGLGFAAAQSIVYSWLLITGPFQRSGSATSWALPTLRTSLMVPLLYAATTGLICAALWLRRDPQPPTRSLGILALLPVATVVALLAEIVPALGNDLYGGLILALIWYGVVLVIMLVVLRHVLHVALTSKAKELGHGGMLRCPQCFHDVPDVPFCPNCGLAMRSTAKRARRAAVAGGQQHE
ncbi:MAG TPA: PrsW family glutamic-type intramembrane protease [Ktedonobacterales bacterium]|nr:PrsW family glutamic-type intramembrane protease [Ktedonobacterales bacterium]